MRSKQFWTDKFNYNQLPILSAPSFQEYNKIINHRNRAQQILVANEMNPVYFNEIKTRKDLMVLEKLLINCDIPIGTNIVSILIYPVSVRKTLTIHCHNDKIITYASFHDISSCQDIVNILIKSLHYRYEISHNCCNYVEHKNIES